MKKEWPHGKKDIFKKRKTNPHFIAQTDCFPRLSNISFIPFSVEGTHFPQWDFTVKRFVPSPSSNSTSTSGYRKKDLIKDKNSLLKSKF